MLWVSEVFTGPPAVFSTPLQEQTYRALAELKIGFQRVETEEAVTMEDCIQINERLSMDMVKTLLVCDRRQENYYLFVTKGGKPFRTREFSSAMGTSRLSFAPITALEQLLGVQVGAATVFSLLLESAKEVRLVLDREVADEDWYGCSDGTTTGYLKLRTRDIIERFLPYSGHSLQIIEA